MRSPRSRRASSGVLVLLLVTAGASAAGAAQTTWADPAGLCNGESPCFTALADAVANAGPAPATVFVFPGTYPESVDLGTMGSALPGGGAGELSVVSVDATGQPAPGALVDPGAPGGPGTGAALFATSFPAALTLDGLSVRSPDASGIELVVGTATVHLLRVTADDSPAGNGVGVVHESGDIVIEECSARFNGGAGFGLLTLEGTVTVAGSLAERNVEAGFGIGGVAIAVSDTLADANSGPGILLLPAVDGASFSLSDVEATLNQAGVAMIFGADTFALGVLDGATLTSNLGDGLALFADQLTATGVTAIGNGSTGAALLGGVVEVTDSLAQDNGLIGLTIAGDDATATGLTATGNGGFGVWLLPFAAAGGTAALTDVEASGNATGVTTVNPAGVAFGDCTIRGVTATANLDAGVVAGAETLLLDDVTATGNGGIGITALAVDTRLVDCRSAGNLTGFLTTGERVTLLGCSATANGPFGGGTFDGNGFVLAQVDRVEIADALALDNDFGWLILDLAAPAAPAGVDLEAARRELERLAAGLPRRPRVQGGAAPQEISIVTSRTEGSTGASMQLALREQGTLSVRCSDFVANGSAGLALFTDNEVDARGSFWGHPSGPTHPNNPAGAGDAIHDAAGGFAGTVLFDPFLEAPASASDCLLPGEALEIPTLGPAGLLLLVLALALAAWRLLGRLPPVPHGQRPPKEALR